MFLQHAIQSDARGIFFCKSQSRLFLATPLIISHASSKSHSFHRALKCSDPHIPPFEHLLTAYSLCSCAGLISFGEPALPLIAARLRADIPVVPATSLNARVHLWPHNDHRTVPSPRARGPVVDIEWNVEGGCGGSSRLCSRPCWVVRTRRLDARDDRGPDHPQRPSRSSVRSRPLS